MINTQTESHKGDILIVDDDLPSLNILSSILTNQGYEIRGVPDGQKALTEIEIKPPELILLDVRMPDMDGFELCRQLKADEKASGIPVLFLSALNETADRVKGFTAGAVDFISKPFQMEEVLARVDTHITLSRLRKNLERQVAERTAELTEIKEALSKHLEFEHLIAEIAARLANVQPETIDAEIQETLSSLGRFLKSERAFVFQFTDDEKSLKTTHVWAAEGFSPQSKIFEMDLASDIPWVARQIRSGRVIAVGPGYVGLPDEAQELRKQLERDGINSGFVVPISVEGRPIGMLGLDTVDKARDYPPLLIDRLRALADLIGSILQRVGTHRILEQYQHIVESTASIVGLVDQQYVYQYVNDACCVAFKKDRLDIIGRSVADLFGQEMFDQELKPNYDRCFTGEEISFQSCVEFPGWGKRIMDVYYSPFFGHDRKVSAVVVSAHDITESKQLEMELEKSETQFRAFMNNIPASIYIKDENDRHIFGNQVAFEAVGMKPEEFVGSTTRDLWPSDMAERLIELDQKVLSEEVPRITEEFRKIEIDDTRWLRDIKFPIKLASGKKLLGGIAIDITEIKQSEQTLAEQLEFEQLIADLAAQFARTGPAQLEESIDASLQALGRFLGTERAFLGQFSRDNKSLKINNIWAAEGITFPPAVLEDDFASDLTWPASHIQAGGAIIAGPGLVGLPDEAKELRHWLKRNGITSGVVVPVSVQEKSIGMLGLDTLHQPREYPLSLVNRLKIVADIIGSTLHRVRSQEAIHDQLQFEDLISKLSSTFIHIKASEIDDNIERGLQLIVEFLDIQRGNLFQFSRDHGSLTLTHSFARKGMSKTPLTLFSSQYPWFTKKLLRRETISFSNPTELPKEANAEKEYLVQQGIKSALIFPLVAAGVTHGAITFSSLNGERQWSEKLIQQFRILLEVFSNALLRKRADEKIAESLTEIKQLKDRVEQENIYLREEIEVNYKHEEIVGRSKPVIEMLGRAEQVAETDATVLILGETGTGKELLARSIHKLSRRKSRQMIKVNCAALPPTLIESELFGREKGAFTGAMTRQIGRFEIADKSTIFLDEIGELPLDVQAKLLRVLQEGQFERLGNPKTINVNVRIIASTNRDLTKAIVESRFREDLYYRLNVFSITVPPLRDRPEDIPLLVWAFVKDLEKSMGKSIEKIPQKSIEALQQYSWPGNIRELRNAVENAMIISTGKILKLIPPVDQSVGVAKDLKLEVVERNHIIDVLEKTSWRVSGERGAAKLLGLKPTTLESRMKKLGIVRPR